MVVGWGRDEMGEARRVPPAHAGDLSATASAALDAARAAVEAEDLEQARRLAEEALGTFRRLGDRGGVASVEAVLGWVGYLSGDHEASLKAYGEALEIAETVGDRRGAAVARLGLANAILLVGAEGADVERAAALAQRALDEMAVLGDDRSAAWAAYSLTGMYRDLGRGDEARRVADQCLDFCARAGDARIAGLALLSVAHLARHDGDLERALTLARQSLLASRASRSIVQPLRCLTFIASLATAAGDDERAAMLYGATASLRTRYGHPIARTAVADDIARDVATLRARNRDDALWEWLARGAGLSLESAVALADEPL